MPEPGGPPADERSAAPLGLGVGQRRTQRSARTEVLGS
jgi:hypothetical protein